MAESLSSSTSVSRQIYADLRSALRAYGNNQSSAEEETRTYDNNGQIIRKAFSDIQSSLPRTVTTKENTEQEETLTNKQTEETAVQTNNTQTTEQTSNKTEVKTITLPKSTETILTELKRNGLSRTKTAYQIADEYGITYMRARELLDKLNTDRNAFVREYNLPENSTISYKV